MALRFILKKATINCSTSANPFTATTTTRNLWTRSVGSVNNGGHHVISRRQSVGFRNFDSDCSKFRSSPPLESRHLPDYPLYRQLLNATGGFGICIDLGDYPDLIRPYRGSLDDPVITDRARFAVEEYNQRQNKHLQFVKVVNANKRCDSYYLTLDAIDDIGKRMRYLALIDSDKKSRMHLTCFDLFGDADNPPPYYVKKGMDFYPRDYFKYFEQVDASEGFYVDDGLYTGPLIGRILPFRGPLDDPMLSSIAHFAVNQYNRNENAQLQFFRVVRATYQLVSPRRNYYLTFEADDASERKIYQAKINLDMRGLMHLMLFRSVDDDASQIKHVH